MLRVSIFNNLAIRSTSANAAPPRKISYANMATVASSSSAGSGSTAKASTSVTSRYVYADEGMRGLTSNASKKYMHDMRSCMLAKVV